MARVTRSAMPGLIATIVCIAAWELAIRAAGPESGVSIPAPSQIFGALVALLGDSGFWVAAGQTLLSSGLGLIIATVAALALGVLYGTFVFVRHSTTGILELLRPIPPVALLPVGLLLFGTSLEMKLALVIYTSFWPVFIQTTYGMRDIDSTLIDMARIHRVRRMRRLAEIVIPSIGPYFVVGLRLSVVGALIASIVTELIGGAPGLGYALGIAQSTGQTESMYALIIAIGLLGLGLDRLFSLIERRTMRWSPNNRERGNS
ncbi:MAG: ABC transporter permease [Actinobacteria bacterium]|nr:ABC transporter permease [Actinomycetota bacterium]